MASWPRLLVEFACLDDFEWGLTPLSLVLTAALLDVIVRSLSQAHALAGLDSAALRLLLLIGGLVVGGQLIMYVQQTIQTLYQLKVTNVIKLRLAEHAAQLDLAFFDNPSFHNRLSNASNEAAGISTSDDSSAIVDDWLNCGHCRVGGSSGPAMTLVDIAAGCSCFVSSLWHKRQRGQYACDTGFETNAAPTHVPVY